MLRFERLSKTIDELSTGAKAIGIAVVLIGALTAGLSTGKAVMNIPNQLAMHDSTERSSSAEQLILTRRLLETDQKMLCIQVQDHRKQDWTQCLIAPMDDTNANH